MLVQPILPDEPPQLPETMFSYKSVPRRITRPKPDPDGHYKLGAKVCSCSND